MCFGTRAYEGCSLDNLILEKPDYHRTKKLRYLNFGTLVYTPGPLFILLLL